MILLLMHFYSLKVTQLNLMGSDLLHVPPFTGVATISLKNKEEGKENTQEENEQHMYRKEEDE